MTIAEFMIWTGADPSDPNQMDSFMSTEFGYYYDESGQFCCETVPSNYGPPTVVTGMDVVTTTNQDINTHVLDRITLDALARSHGYEILDFSTATIMAFYKRQAVRLNFCLSTGTVESYVQHKKRGKFKLSEKDVTMEEAWQVFANPRLRSLTNGNSGTQITSKGPCRYGDACYRPNCWFDH